MESKVRFLDLVRSSPKLPSFGELFFHRHRAFLETFLINYVLTDMVKVTETQGALKITPCVSYAPVPVTH
jgi:hypothetical protein